MQPDPEAEGALLVLTIKAALAPVLADLKSLQVQVSGWESRWNDVGALRERVAVVEGKSVAPLTEQIPVDLSPVLERVAAAEARLSILGDLRDRMVTVETKAAMPVVIPPTVEPAKPFDFSPFLERIAAAEAALSTFGDLRDRVVTVETKAAQPVPEANLTNVHSQLSELDFQLKFKSAEVAAVVTTLADHTKEIGTLRERLAAAEARQPVAGPKGDPGEPGIPGTNGVNGTNGADGLGWDDLAVTQQPDERSFTFKSSRGMQTKEHGSFTIPAEIWRGVYLEGKSYDRGDCVTWGGSEWHANETTTTKPGDGSKAWTLKVKRGRDGKDGRDAMTVPVVALKR